MSTTAAARMDRKGRPSLIVPLAIVSVSVVALIVVFFLFTQGQDEPLAGIDAVGEQSKKDNMVDPGANTPVASPETTTSTLEQTPDGSASLPATPSQDQAADQTVGSTDGTPQPGAAQTGPAAQAPSDQPQPAQPSAQTQPAEPQTATQPQPADQNAQSGSATTSQPATAQ